MISDGLPMLHLDLVLELLKGCAWACPGCGVDKLGQDGWAGENDYVKTLDLMREFKEKGYVLDHLEIGPTDFMAAQNTESVLSGLSELQGLFRTTLLTTTFESKDFEKWSEFLNSHMRDSRINFFHVLDVTRVNDPDYLEQTKDNRDRFLKSCQFEHDLHPHPLVNVFYGRNAGSLAGAAELIEEYLGRSPYFAFSIARSGATSMRKLRDSIDKINFEHNEVVPLQKRPSPYYGNSKTGWSRHYVYKEGEWFWPPILYSPLVSFHESFKIPATDWSVSEFEKWEQCLEVEGLQNASPNCLECEFFSICHKNGIPKLQKTLETGDCIAPKRALEVWN